MPYKSTLITLAIIAIVFITSLVASYFAPVQVMELKYRDFLFELRGEQDVSHSDIIIIEMGQEADEEIPYKYPWPTYIYANLIENLNRAGAKAIAIDVIFDQPDMYDPKNDSLFAEAVANYENVVLASRYQRRVGPMGEQSSYVNPNDLIRRANPNPSGLVNTVNDQDGFLRKYLLQLSHMDERRYALSLELIRLLYGDDEFETYHEDGHLHFGPFKIPTFSRNQMHINYYGPSRTFEFLGMEYIIDDKDFDTVTEREAFEMNLFDDPEIGILHRDILRDKIVLVGATMPELQDFHPVPMKRGDSNLMAGVEIHAHALQMILDQNYLRLGALHWNLFILLLLSVLVVFGARNLSAWKGLFLTITVLVCWLIGSFYLFAEYQIILLYTGPILAVVFGYSGVNAYQYFREEREKKRIRGMFSSYVSPDLVDRMIETDDAFRLGGKEAELTAFFSDVANFSTLSEQLSASKLIELMNEYLEEMTKIVMEDEGTLDKYIGDAVMAFYGAPLQVEGHPMKACRSALKMQGALSELRSRWKEKDQKLPKDVLNFRIRIGINTGKMVVGNMGSSQRFNYTILGDNVNIAARCEAACKKYGISIMVTEHTKNAVESIDSEQMVFRFLDNIRVKGRVAPLKVYELVGFRKKISERALAGIDLFEKGIAQFYKRNWDEAEKLFCKSAEIEEEILGYDTFKESPSSLYIKRCELFRKENPGDDWDGVFEQTGSL